MKRGCGFLCALPTFGIAFRLRMCMSQFTWSIDIVIENGVHLRCYELKLLESEVSKP
jgi:hypothetical protein